MARLREALRRPAAIVLRRLAPASTALESPAAPDLTHAAHVQDLHERCSRRLRAGAGHLRVDLTAVTRVDTKLVASLVALRRAASLSGQAIEVLPSEAVRDWLRICRLEAMLPPPPSTTASSAA